MKNTKSYKIAVALFIVALVLFAASIVTGLIPNLVYSVDKITMYLGFASFGFGLVFLSKAKKESNKEEK